MCSLYERIDRLKAGLIVLSELKNSNNNLGNSDRNARLLSNIIGFNDINENKPLIDSKSRFWLKLCKTSDKMLTNEAIIETKNAENRGNINKTNGKYFKCFWPKCQFKTLESKQLKDHYSVHQKTKNQFKCDVNNCQKVFKYKQNLIQHKLSHKSQTINKNLGNYPQKLQLIARNGGKNGNFGHKSDENGKNGHKSGLIFAHKSNVLLNSTKMTTNIQNNSNLTDGSNDGQVFGLKSTEKANSESKRTQLCRRPKDKRFICDYSGCDKCFDSKSNLERHKRIHSGEKPFGCDIPGCGQRFTQKTHLVQHKKRKHRIILPKNAIKLIKPDGLDDTPVTSPAVSVDTKPVADSGVISANSATKSSVVFTAKPYVTPKSAVNSSAKPYLTPNSTKTSINSPKSAINSIPSTVNTPKFTTITAKTAVNTPKSSINSKRLSVNSSANKSAVNSGKTLTNASDRSRNSNELKVNPRVNPTDKQYKCYLNRCQSSYESLYELKTHINSVHTKESLNKCHEINCNVVFKSFYNLYWHKKTFHKLV